MLSHAVVHRKLESVFDRDQAEVLAEVISDLHEDLVKASDFAELKEIVRELGWTFGPEGGGTATSSPNLSRRSRQCERSTAMSKWPGSS